MSHIASEFYLPPEGTDLVQWIADHVPSYDAIDTAVEVAELPAVRVSTTASSQADGSDECLVVHEGQLFRIVFIHTGGQQDWDLYGKFVQSLSFG